MIGKRVSHYRIIEKLGSGGMGDVYLAEDLELDRRVALKILPAAFAAEPGRLQRFVREAKAASALNHPNVATIYEIREADGVHFIAMEYVAGKTLEDLDKPLDADGLIKIAVQIGDALEAAHSAGVIHRDIKPSNVMITSRGQAKLLDFGIAKRIAPARSLNISEMPTANPTIPGLIAGTVAYMSPEQVRGEAITTATDIFSLGIVLYELATGQHPFRAQSWVETLHAILSADPIHLAGLHSGVPPMLNEVVLRMLSKDPVLRPSAAELRIELMSGSPEAKLPPSRAAKPHTVGREKERMELRAGFESALSGKGLLLCVSGEPGIGKTTLVEDFIAELTAEGRCTVARGRSSERLAGTEAYLPWLEALESLLQSETNPAVGQVMKQIAPTWYAQVVPVFRSDEGTARLTNEVRAASQERMKRELGAFLQEVSRSRPLVLFFDDLHWADVSTIDLLSFLAGKFEALGVMILVTYRPSDLLILKHPFLQIKPDLQARGACRELELKFLTQAEIAEYLALEFPGHHFAPDFTKVIHAKTEGSPLFMTDLVRYLRDRSVIAHANGEWRLAQALPDVERELPESVRGMIEHKIAQLGEEDRRLLVAASVQGYEFDSAAVAQVLNIDAGEVEERLEKLERVYAFVRLVSERELPDRTLTLRYRFVHVLYQNALYGSLRPTRKMAVSRQVAEALEGFYGQQRMTVASDLAALWEAAREYARAAEYFRLAAEQASQVMAAREAAALVRRGLKMIEMVPESRERREQELSLQVVLGNALFATQGYAATEVEQTYSRAYEIGQWLDAPQFLLPALYGLTGSNRTRGRHRKALAYSEEFLHMTERLQGDTVVVGHTRVGASLYYLGELEKARDHLQQSASLYTPSRHRSLTWLYGHDPGTYAQIYLSWTQWLLGQPDQALAHASEALRLSREVSHANSQAYALICVATTCQWCRDRQRVGELAEEGVAFSAEQGLPFWHGLAMSLRGWARAEQGQAPEGIAEMRSGIASYRSTGAEMSLTYHLCLLAEAYETAGQPSEGLAALAEAQAVVEKNEERFWEAELYRLKGELLLMGSGATQEAATSFQQATEIARRQRAKSLELRAVMSLSRFWQGQGKAAEAYKMLADIYGWFTEGFETADLKDAKALLDKLS